jgi:hypothetical protein
VRPSARAQCHQAVKVDVPQAREREAEFEKCKANPVGYLQLKKLKGNEETGAD